jgi:hypothetical protein
MKHAATFALFLLSTTVAFAQEIITISIEVKKGYPLHENTQDFNFKLGILTDISSFTYNLDQNKSVFTKVIDDTGFDLLAAQKAFEKSYDEKGYSYNKLGLAYDGPINGGVQPGIIVRSSLGVAPHSGAKSVTVQGVIAMINLRAGEETYTLKDVPSKYEWGGPGVQTDIGEVKITESGSFSFDGQSFSKYRIESGKPVTSVRVIGGDDSDEATKHGIALQGNEMVFKNIPEKLELVVTARDTEIKEIPFNLELTIGL